MKAPRSRKTRKENEWPRKIRLGRVTVPVYRRRTPSGHWSFMVANYAEGKRRFDSYPNEPDAIEAATRLVRQMSERDVLSATMTREQAVEFASATQTLQPFNISLTAAASTLVECLRTVGGLADLQAAARAYAARNTKTTAKRIADVVSELIEVKKSRKASDRYLSDLRYRLNGFSKDFQRDACNVTTAEIQSWLDGLKLEPQGYTNFRRVLNLLFNFAVARGYASFNPVEGVERLKVANDADVAIYTPDEFARLLKASTPDFVPALVFGGLCGLRSSEVERLEWSDVNLPEKFARVRGKVRSAGRRIVPICDAAVEWLTPYGDQRGKVWNGAHDQFYDRQKEVASATAVAPDPKKKIKAQEPVQWKTNALRHSYASYRFALIGDAGRVAGELGNSTSVVHRHYRELVTAEDAKRWFDLKPTVPANVAPMKDASA